MDKGVICLIILKYVLLLLVNYVLLLGATSIVKIGEVRLSDEIGGGVKDFKKTELYNYY